MSIEERTEEKIYVDNVLVLFGCGCSVDSNVTIRARVMPYGVSNTIEVEDGRDYKTRFMDICDEHQDRSFNYEDKSPSWICGYLSAISEEEIEIDVETTISDTSRNT